MGRTVFARYDLPEISAELRNSVIFFRKNSTVLSSYKLYPFALNPSITSASIAAFVDDTE